MFSARTGWLVLAVCAPAILFPGALTAVSVALLCLWLVGWIGIGRGSSAPRIWIALSAVTLASALEGTATAFDRSYSLPKLLGYLVGIAGLLTCAATVRSSRLRAVVLTGTPLLGVGIAVVGATGTSWLRNKSADINAIVDMLPSFSRQAPRSAIAPPGGFGFHPNEVAGTMALFVAFGSVIVLSRDPRITRINRLGAVAGIVVCGAVLLVTQSRAGLAATLAGISFGLLARFWSRLFRASAPFLVPTLIGLLAVTIGIFLFRPVSGAAVFDAIDRASFDSGSGAGRWSLWDRSLEMIRDHWLTGIGLNTFPFVLDTQYPDRETIAPTLSELQVPHAHNLLLQTVLDLGAPGAAAVVSLTVLAFAGWMRGRRTASDAVSDGAAAAIVAFLTFGLADAIALGAKPSLLYWVFLGLMVASDEPSTSNAADRVSRRARLPEAVAAIVTLVMLVAAGAQYWRGDWRPAEWRAIATAVDRLSAPADLVVINAVPAAVDEISAAMRRPGPSIGPPVDDARVASAVQGYRTVWLIDTIDAVSQPGGLRPRYWLDLRGQIVEMYRVERALLLRYELVATP